MLFIAFNSSQNLMSQALEDDGLGKLGFWSIAVMYFAIAIGSLFSSVVQRKIGEIKCMAIGSVMNIPWILSLALCGLKKERPDDHSWYLDSQFISILILVLSFLNGLG